jgi:hypothetical protein
MYPDRALAAGRAVGPPSRAVGRRARKLLTKRFWTAAAAGTSANGPGRGFSAGVDQAGFIGG